jgi:hypothetical protein
MSDAMVRIASGRIASPWRDFVSSKEVAVWKIGVHVNMGSSHSKCLDISGADGTLQA